MAEQEPVEKENIVELHAIEHDKIPAKAAATRNSGRPNRLKQRKIDKRKTLKTDVFKVFLARKERFELSRRSYRPTGVRSQTLQPLGYISILNYRTQLL